MVIPLICHFKVKNWDIYIPPAAHAGWLSCLRTSVSACNWDTQGTSQGSVGILNGPGFRFTGLVSLWVFGVPHLFLHLRTKPPAQQHTHKFRTPSASRSSSIRRSSPVLTPSSSSTDPAPPSNSTTGAPNSRISPLFSTAQTNCFPLSLPQYLHKPPLLPDSLQSFLVLII